MPVAEFGAAIRLGMGKERGEVLEGDEVECLIANMIYKVRVARFRVVESDGLAGGWCLPRWWSLGHA